jgi:predicted dehydrogenase
MTIRFAAIGLSHGHIYNMADCLLPVGAELVWFWGDEPERVQEFGQRYPQAKLARSVAEILEDATIQLIVSAAVPDQHANLGIQAMQHGKDYETRKFRGQVSCSLMRTVNTSPSDRNRSMLKEHGWYP